MIDKIWLAPPLSRLVLKLASIAEPRGHQLMMGVDVVRTAHDDAIHVLVREACFSQRVS